MGAILVVSPHLDDGVLSCAHLMLQEPGSAVVVTVLAGHPGRGVLSDWDRSCGFVDGDDPVAHRRGEDRHALALLGARPRHLDFLDLPYRRGRTAAAGGLVRAAHIGTRLASIVEELSPSRVLIPLGLMHPDHELTHDGGALLLRASPSVELWMYKDLPYGLAHPHRVASRLEHLRRGGLRARPVAVAPAASADMKCAAVACYASQAEQVRNDLGRDAWEQTCSVSGEQFWQLGAA